MGTIVAAITAISRESCGTHACAGGVTRGNSSPETVLFARRGLSPNAFALTILFDPTIGTAMDACPNGVAEAVELGADRVVLRPIRPGDRSAYADFIARTDAPDLRRRFYHPHGLSPEIDLERQARIDHNREVAFVAVRPSRAGAEEILGEARASLYPGTSTAELVIIVRSDMQRRGLGHVLMRKMIEHCAAHGLELIARILPENNAMIRLARRSGMQVEHRPGSNLAIAHMRAGSRESSSLASRFNSDLHQLKEIDMPGTSHRHRMTASVDTRPEAQPAVDMSAQSAAQGSEVEIGIAEAQRQAVVAILNTVLADEFVLYLKSRRFHWNVEGLDFSELHDLFQKQYEQLGEIIDDVAERARALDGIAAGSLEEYVKLARLDEAPGKRYDARGMIAALLADHESIIRNLRRDLGICASEHGDEGTMDFLTGLMQAHEKIAWMLRAHLR